jgi:NAD-dependent dihydropyrimidine dehydrogenase PreA subunit
LQNFVLILSVPAGKIYADFGILLLLKEEQGTMYMVTIDKGKCDGDGTCVNMCPQSVFKVDGGKADPINMSECINCLTCVENCPQQAITVNEI